MESEMTAPVVNVVMSTYNGAEYIERQIDSVLGQQGVDVRLLVRDDGSKDDTLPILRRYEFEGKLRLVEGSNVGVAISFFEGMSHVPQEGNYIALCDQDDEWNPDKLYRAVRQLEHMDQNVPLLYASELNYCDGDLNFVALSHLNRQGVSCGTELYENICSGNTMVFNRSLMNRALNCNFSDIYCHDWWLALVAVCFGEVVYDSESHLLYRRTGANVSPSGKSGAELFLWRCRKFLGKDGELSNIKHQVKAFMDCYCVDMTNEKRRIVSRFAYGNRFAKAFSPVRLRQSVKDEVAVRALILAGKL